MSFRAIFSSDWHLDARTAGSPRRQDLEAAADAVCDRCIETDSHLIFVGDLADPWKPSSHAAVAKAISIAMLLREHALRSYWVVGNHDVIEDGTGDHLLMALRSLSSTHVIEAPGVRPGADGMALHFLPYPSATRMYDPAQWVRDHKAHAAKHHVFIGHLQLPMLLPGSESTEMPRGKEVAWPLDAIAEVYPGATVIAGHHHHGQHFEHRGLQVHVIGSLGRLTFGEQDHAPRYLELEL